MARQATRIRPNGRPILTEKQWGLLYGWVDGLSTQAAAHRKGIHPHSYREAQRRLMKLLQAKSVGHAVFRSIQLGLIDPSTYEPVDDWDGVWGSNAG